MNLELTFLNLGLFVFGISLIGLAFIGLSFFLTCLKEREKRAAGLALLQLAGMLVVVALFLSLTASGFFHRAPGTWIFGILFLLGIVAMFVILRREAPNMKALAGSTGYAVGPVSRFDERCLVFARNRSLPEGSDMYRQYYDLYPEHEAFDRKRREKGGTVGLIGKIDRPDSGFETAMAIACLSIPQYLSKPEMIRPTQSIPAKQFVHFETEFTPEEASRRIKGFARHLGADLVGIARINPDWIYAKRGEIFHQDWENWGKPIELNHTYAIVFAEEMNLDLTAMAPHTPTVIESMRNYAKGAVIATQMASFIASLGYAATANHLRHYELILPPVAVDAGLGELSRMGYVITKEFGPRIRLSAVTTNMPLIPDTPVDLGVQSFCRICKKCALCCPSRSIPDATEPSEHNGTLRWKLDEQSCFNYWGTIGTDCNVCMRVCPWSHDRSWPHRLIVNLTGRNRFNQRLFTWMDDLFYGKKPKAKNHPESWARFKTG